MKRTLTVFVLFLLVVAMVASFAACDTGSGDKSEQDVSGTNSTEVSGTGDTSTETPVDTGEYVYKDAVTVMPTNWNPHTYQTTDDSYPAAFLRSGFYDFVFNDALHPVEGKEPYEGYVIINEMAESRPVDVTAAVRAAHPEFNIPASAEKGYAYTIDLNKNAKWEDGTVINADSYVYSMKRLLDSTLINYRAADYYSSGDFCIAGAEAYANSGRTVKKVNSADGDAVDFAFSALVKGEDGYYTTADGAACYFGLKTGYGWMSGDTLEDYKSYMGDVYDQLLALADEEGYVKINDAAIDLLFSFTNSDTWSNETRDDLAYYVSYNVTYPVAEYSQVGLYKSGEYQITLVLAKSLSGFNLLYNLTSNWLVYEPYYEANLTKTGDTYSSTYNTSVDTTMSYGPYKLTAYQSGADMTFEKNENWYGYTDGQHTYVDPTDGKTYNMYQTTKIHTRLVEKAETRKMMFLAGELMGYGLQAEDFAQYRSSKYVHATPSETIYFMIFNGYSAKINEREKADDFDETKYDLQTMTITEFRKAFALVYDKELFASTISPARSGGYGLIGSAYIYDPETGARYRDTDQAKKALCDFYNVDVTKFDSLDDAAASITGYDPAGAKVYFKEAFDKALELGYITDADNDGICDQIVRLEYCSSATSAFITKTINYMNEKAAEVTAGTPFEGKVEIFESAPYGNQWSNKIKGGLSDLVLGGWSGSALNPFSLTDLYVNPDQAYDAQWFAPATIDLTLTVKVNGADKEITTNITNWSNALNGTTITVDGTEYNFGADVADVDTRLDILAAIETKILGTYDYIPMLQDGGMSLLSQQVYYVVEEYNPIMGRGGIAYMKYNYNETEWAAYVASQNNQLSY